MRAPDDGSSPMTRIRHGLPAVEIALGAFRIPGQHTIFQQLHNYPVGNSGAERASNTKGSKYNVVPARRAFLSDIDAYLCAQGDENLEQRVRDGLAGKHGRYGLPFLGDNNFLLDRAEVIDETKLEPAYWYVRLELGDDRPLSEDVARLTVTIDRADMSRTNSPLFRPTAMPTKEIPDKGCWTLVRYV